MALPATAILDGIRSLSGKARITFPGGVKTMERVARFPKADWELDFDATTVDPEDSTCILIDQQKLKEDAQYIEAYRIYKKLPGPEIAEDEYVPEINEFILTKKSLVYNLNQTGSRAGGTAGADLTVTEYKATDNPRVRIKIVSVLPFAVLGTSRTFQRVIQYSVPNEIPDTPTLIKAYAIKPPPNILNTIAESSYVTDYAFDYRVKGGYSGPFTATVTRTISLTAATDTPVRWQEAAEFKNIPITLSNNQIATGAAARGKIVEIRFPSCIHPSWTISFGNVFTVTGTRIIIYTDTTQTVVDTDTIYPIGDEPTDALPAGMWKIIPVITSTPLSVTFPATSPATVTRGTPIIAAVQSQDWRFSLFINDVYRITIPA